MPDQTELMKSLVNRISDPSLRAMAEQMINAKPSETIQKKRELQNLRTEAGIKKLTPPQTTLEQSERDKKKFDEFTKIYDEQNRIVTSQTKDNTLGGYNYNYEPDIRESAIGKRNEMADSLRLWYEWDALRKKGIDISLNDLREYKKVQEKEKFSLLQPSINQMKARGFSEKTINMFAINYTNFVNKGDDPQTALAKAYQLTKITFPTDFIMKKGK